jgi:tetratricopeptide (TPR) repeat protein
MRVSAQARPALLICALLALGILFTYGPTVTYGFVNYDDPSYISENPEVQHGFTAHSIAWAFTTNHTGYWHPLTWLSLMLDLRIYGLHPGGIHFTSVLLHLADTLLLFWLLRRMTGATWRSGIVAALFAWHPLHVESVAWISERKDVLSAFFSLLTIWAYLNYVAASREPAETATARPKPSLHYTAALVLFACGLMSKPMVVTLPFVLLLLDYWPLERHRQPVSWHRLVVEKIPFLVLSVVCSVVTFAEQQQLGSVASFSEQPPAACAANAFVSYARYLGKTFWPSQLVMFYPMPDSWPAWQVAGAICLLAALTLAALALRRRQPWLIVGWLWFLGTLVPVIGFVHSGLQAMADRYTYLPSIGLFIALVWGLATLHDRLGSAVRHALQAAGALALAACLVLTAFQVRTWRDSFTLFNHLAELPDARSQAHQWLGESYVKLNRLNDAVAEYQAAARLAPRSPVPLYYLGWLAARQGNAALALNYYQGCLTNDPGYSAAHFEIANLLANAGRLTDAVAEYRISIRGYSLAPDAHLNLGKVLMALGSPQDAASEFKAALQIDPDNPEALDQLGGALQKLGRLDQACALYAEAVRLDPAFVHARLKLGLILGELGKSDDAARQFTEVLRLDPTNVPACYNLGGLFQARGLCDQAAAAFAQASRLQPADADIHARLAGSLACLGNFTNAVAQYRQALSLKPDSPAPMCGLATLLATCSDPGVRNGAEAVRLAEHARDLTHGRNPAVLTALDEAYAEAGRFDDAIRAAQSVHDLALANQNQPGADAATQRIALYRAGKPFRQ